MKLYWTTGIMGCVAAIATGCSRGPAQGGGEPPNPTVPVKVQVVKTTDIQESSEFVGTLEARQKVELRPRIEGRIERIFARSGDRVAAETAIISLQPNKDQAQLRAATENINVQRANLNSVRAELSAAEAQQSQAEARAQSAQALLQSQEAEIKRQQAEVQSQEAEVKLREDEYQRTLFLVSQGVQSQQTLDEKTRNLATARASLASARASLESNFALRSSQAEALNAARSAEQESKERVKGALAALDREKASIKQAEAQQDSATQDFQFTRVTAPIAGTVGDIPVKVGDVVDSKTVLTSITQNDNLELRLSVPIESATRLRIGLPVQLVFAPLRGSLRDRPIQIEGNISFISPQVDRTAQSVLAKATFPNEAGNLRDGQTVKAKVLWSQKKGIAIPTTAVSRIAGQSFVFVAVPAQDGKGGTIAQQKPVTLGALQGQTYPVLKGIKPGDRIAVEGVLKLRNGSPIEPSL
ncbi:efflux RND transporter periplasmic adaptor subunit [Oscillatoria sp. FACHB-1406]|uniref:efflux RND transporter periplasmic adaptor subunit n=1 Tax=Oscillatoria sp. FACHB-1406 TaxID=2692846 RepID=UPI0016879C5D|nr:efflux RND transporter periplasmic adaptor subunit [Oscillatoria sp. FACHB-1406]MBD2578800.1 efflux RND transporter periplasmic adaptor subunit [Oscillatoria sp. FACHB-1406]